MCGITGIINFNNSPINASHLVKMNTAIGHRGPDDEGIVLIDQKKGSFRNFGTSTGRENQEKLQLLKNANDFKSANLGLGHRRFSIIDLTEAGHQPFFLKDNSCCLVFNGEIYNYIELKQELLAKGVSFYSHSDTEVLLAAYRFWGTECFSKFNGFWALAIYDFKSKQLILSRDRLGKKPLFYTRSGETVFFASEIKALLQIPSIYQSRRVNDKAVYYWLLAGQKNLFNESFFEGIFSFPAGSWAYLDSIFPDNISKFWNIPSQRFKEKDISPKEAIGTVRNLFEESVKIRLRADVPVSATLSGGMDSSSIVAIASNLQPQKLTTYTVRFAEKQWNEEPFARSVAQQFNTDYKVLESPIDNFWQSILSFTYLEEEPYHAPNLQTHQEVWQQMRSAGVKVVLAGSAGDEVFAGYQWYLGGALVENVLCGDFMVFLKNILRNTESKTPIHSLKQLVAPLLRNRRNNFNRTKQPYFLANKYQLIQPGITLTDRLLSDMNHTLIPYWLCSGDRGYMGVPVEQRMPFLDFKLIDYVYQLPVSYLIRDGWHKWILRKAMEDILPRDVVWRKTKLGFPFPFERFFAEHRNIVELIFKHSDNPYIDYSRKETLYSNWKTISFVLWYELFINENISLFQNIETMAKPKEAHSPMSFKPAFHDTCQKVQLCN